jgi:hypothetical protein
MRACGHGSLPPLAHLLWKLDRCEDAARVIGAFDACARSGLEFWTANDARLLAAARAGVAARLAPETMAAQAALGANLDRPRLHAWLAQELAANPA